MNATNIILSWRYTMEGHATVNSVDAGFFQALPHADEQFLNAASGRPEVPRPDVVQVLSVVGTAILSSSVLAAFIKAYLANRRIRIRISVGSDKIELEYEGPNLKESEQEINQALDSLVARMQERRVRIEAVRLPAGDRD